MSFRVREFTPRKAEWGFRIDSADMDVADIKEELNAYLGEIPSKAYFIQYPADFEQCIQNYAPKGYDQLVPGRWTMYVDHEGVAAMMRLRSSDYSDLKSGNW